MNWQIVNRMAMVQGEGSRSVWLASQMAVQVPAGSMKEGHAVCPAVVSSYLWLLGYQLDALTVCAAAHCFPAPNAPKHR